MNQLKAIKCRIYPNSAQRALFSQFFGAKRWIYNHFLAINIERYDNKEKRLSNFDCNKEITKLKQEDETSWLTGIDDWCLKHASEDLSVAYNNFFDSLSGKRKGPKLKKPKFKSLADRQSYRTRGIKVTDKGLKVPKIKSPIKIVLSQPITGEIKQAAISKNQDGRYYVSILVETDIPLQPMSHREVGCDLGLKDLLILSNGLKFLRPDVLPNIAKTKRILKIRQRQFSRTKKGSKNREKRRVQLARAYSKLTRQRNEYYHLISRYLVNNFDTIHLEHLQVMNMKKNRKLSRAIHEVAWSTLVSMISYKANWAGKTVHQIDTFFPSSKTCSNCGEKNNELHLGIREWECRHCGIIHDRDLNAATNILHRGQLDLYGHKLSVATTEMDIDDVPLALMKMISKIERSGANASVGHRIGQTTRSSVA